MNLKQSLTVDISYNAALIKISTENRPFPARSEKKVESRLTENKENYFEHLCNLTRLSL